MTMETQCLHHNYPGTQVIAAYVKAREGPSDRWYFAIVCDEEAESPTGSAMSTRLSKRYASYDEAVLGMNKKLAVLLSPDLTREAELCTSDDPNDHQGDTCPVHEEEADVS